MRRSFGLLLVLICGAATAARAGEPAPTLILPNLAPSDSFNALLDGAQPDAAQVRWRSTQVKLTPKSHLRVNLTDPLIGPGASRGQAARLGTETGDYEVTLVRDFPKAVSFNTGKVGVDLTPHAGLGMTPYGTVAEAGARMEISQRMDDAAVASLGAIGVRDGALLGDKGRWYMFAAASGRAVGINMMRSDAGGWAKGGWTTDQSSTLVGDAQIGVGWRKGAMQTSLGVLHREAKAQHTYFGYTSRPDTVAGFTFAVRPGQ